MINSRDLNELLPVVKKHADMFLMKCKELNLNVLVTSTYRDKEWQDFLYSKGRTLKIDKATGKKIGTVTGLKGGLSPHQYRIALDVCRNEKGREYNNDDKFFEQVGAVAKSFGFVWRWRL